MRVSIQDLRNLVSSLNRMNGRDDSVIAPTTRQWKIGTYMLDGAYGGWELQQIVSSTGGVKAINPGGHVSKKELYQFVQLFKNALIAVQEVAR